MSRPADLDLRRASTTVVPLLLVVVASVAARVPFVARPLSPDEGGFLMVAAQWSPGTSLYGDYWVDRPPLLITAFRAVDLAGGGPVSLRLLGIGAVAASVLLAAALAGEVARRDGCPPGRAGRVRLLAAVTAGVFLVSPLFGTTEVNGELLAVPLVLAGLGAALRASAAAPRRSPRWWCLAGVLAVAAAAVKQNMLEVFVAAVVLLAIPLARRTPRGWRDAVRSAGAFAAGAVACLAGILAWAEVHGTSPTALWGAIVTFRFDAAAVIARSATSSTHARALAVAAAFALSGALVLALVALAPATLRGRPRRPAPTALLAAAVLGWELLAAAAGGSYWLHYLIGTVPGLVLATAAAAGAGVVRRAALVATLAYAAVVAVAGVAVAAGTSVVSSGSDVAVEHYLATHERAGDTAVTAFGNPALLESAHLPSPYPDLWSLQVRVLDPHLIRFTTVLAGPHRPTWVVVGGDGLATWGVDAGRAQPVLDREYRLAFVAGDWHVYHLRSA